MCDVTRLIRTWHVSSTRVTHVCVYVCTHMKWQVHVWHSLFISMFCDSFICNDTCTFDMTSSRVIWLVHMSRDRCTCEMTHSHVTWLIHAWHDFIRTWHVCRSFVWHASFIRVTWLIHTCDMPNLSLRHTTDSYIWHGPFIFVTWLMHTCDMTHSYVWHDSFIFVTWLIHTCDMTHSYLWHGSFIRVTWLIHTCEMTHLSTQERRAKYAHTDTDTDTRTRTHTHEAAEANTTGHTVLQQILGELLQVARDFALQSSEVCCSVL